MAKLVIGKKTSTQNEASSKGSWNTPRSNSRTGIRFSTRLAITSALTSFRTAIALVLWVAVVWQRALADYTRANVEEIAENVAARLAEGYEETGAWTSEVLTDASESVNISADIGMQVLDASGLIIYDDTWGESAVSPSVGSTSSSVASASSSTGSSSSATADSDSTDNTAAASSDSSTGGDVGDAASDSETDETADSASDEAADDDEDSTSLVSTAPTDAESVVTVPILSSSGTSIGTLTLWVMGSDALLTAADTEFRSNMINAMGWAAIISVGISIVIGIIASRMLTDPVRRVTDTAKQIRDGNLSARTGMKGDDEISRLGETFDEMAESMEKSLKHEKRLTSDVAHELRTPLMAMQATVEAMQDGVYPTDYEHLETVAAETRRLARLVQQTLDLSRMERGATRLNLEVVDAVQLVRTVVNNQHHMFHEHNLHLRFMDETHGKGAYIEIDPDMITQAVINLMSNAMRYTPEDGWVVVSVAEDHRYVLITVRDTGIGIAKEDLSRIFGRFWRADSSRAREAGGLGVGLSVTKQIVDRHDGFISVESELEKGSTFTIHLPLERDEDASSTTMKR